jgi:undecaprenyl-diphosphatase
MKSDLRRTRSRRNPLGALDRTVTLGVRRLHAERRDRWVGRLTMLGSQYFLIPAAILTSGLLIVAGHGKSAEFLGGAMLFGWMWSPLLKRGFRRGRPDLWPALATEPSHSFPSGHATMSTIFFGGLAIALGRLPGSPFVRGVIVVGCVLVIVGVALSRVYLGAHWLSDVLAGILLGSLWLGACLVAQSALAQRATENAAGHSRCVDGFRPG